MFAWQHSRVYSDLQKFRELADGATQPGFRPAGVWLAYDTGFFEASELGWVTAGRLFRRDSDEPVWALRYRWDYTNDYGVEGIGLFVEPFGGGSVAAVFGRPLGYAVHARERHYLIWTP